MAWPAFTFFVLEIFSYTALNRPLHDVLLQKLAFFQLLFIFKLSQKKFLSLLALLHEFL